MSEGFMPPHGGYHNLLSCRKAQIVYDATVFFCERYIDRRSRTRDQMIQAVLRRGVAIGEHPQRLFLATAASPQTFNSLRNPSRSSALVNISIDPSRWCGHSSSGRSTYSSNPLPSGSCRYSASLTP
jgi:hypothetical protein